MIIVRVVGESSCGVRLNVVDMTAFDVPLDEGTAKKLRRVLLDLAAGMDSFVKRGSIPCPFNKEPLNRQYVTTASLLLEILTAADYVRALGKLVAEPKITVSIHAVARSVIECLGRGHWVATAADKPQATLRAFLFLHKEVQEASKSAIYQSSLGEKEMTSEEYKAKLLEVINDLGGWSEVPGLTRLSVDLLTAAYPDFPEEDCRRKYQELCAGTHGNFSVIGLYGTSDTSLRLPRLIALNVVGSVIGCALFAVRSISQAPTGLFKENAIVDLWEPVQLRIIPILTSMSSQDSPL